MNLGDTYSSNGGHADSECNNRRGEYRIGCRPEHESRHRPPYNLKPKNLVGIPWRVAFALQADGWYLRQDIIWHKPNPMPESVQDRCTKAHEYIFLLSKSERYYYDWKAIREESKTGDPRVPYGSEGAWQLDGRPTEQRRGGKKRERKPAGWDTGSGAHGRVHRTGRAEKVEYSEIDVRWRNRRSVWTVPTFPYPDAHFATFPPDLIKPCIMAGAPSGAVVLDPFYGSGTTGMVSKNLNRRCIGIDRKGEYLQMAIRRSAQEVLQLL